MPCGAEWCHCLGHAAGIAPLCFSRAQALATQKEARATCSSSPLISYTNLIMGSSKGVQQKTRRIPAAQRELIAWVISRKIFTRGSYSGFCFHFANEVANGNEKIKWKRSFLREWVGNWNSAQPSLEPVLCPGHLEITWCLLKLPCNFWQCQSWEGTCVQNGAFLLFCHSKRQCLTGDFTLIHNI